MNKITTLSHTTTVVDEDKMLEQLKLFKNLPVEKQAVIVKNNPQLALIFAQLDLTENPKEKKKKEKKPIDPEAQKMADWYHSLKTRNNKGVHEAAMKALKEGVDLTIVTEDEGLGAASSNLQRLAVIEAGTQATHMSVYFALLKQFRAWREAAFKSYPDMTKKAVEAQFLQPVCASLSGYAYNTLKNRMTLLAFLEKYPRFQNAPVSPSALRANMDWLKDLFKAKPEEEAYWSVTANVSTFSGFLGMVLGDAPAAPAVRAPPSLEVFHDDMEDDDWAAGFSTGSASHSLSSSRNDDDNEVRVYEEHFDRDAERKARKAAHDKKFRETWTAFGQQ